MNKESVDITKLTNDDGCFDLQFRKDTRHERTNSPTYYRWKIQFVITAPKENIEILKKVEKSMTCGSVSIAKDQARFSVQNINDIAEIIVPFFQKNKLIEKKYKDFQLWQKAVEIIHCNKGKAIATWKKHDLLNLLEIHKSTLKYKSNPRKAKWMDMAKLIAKKEPS